MYFPSLFPLSFPIYFLIISLKPSVFPTKSFAFFIFFLNSSFKSLFRIFSTLLSNSFITPVNEYTAVIYFPGFIIPLATASSKYISDAIFPKKSSFAISFPSVALIGVAVNPNTLAPLLFSNNLFTPFCHSGAPHLWNSSNIISKYLSFSSNFSFINFEYVINFIFLYFSYSSPSKFSSFSCFFYCFFYLIYY